MKSTRFLSIKTGMVLLVAMLCSTNALSQQVIGVDENGEVSVSRDTQSRGDDNRAFFEALSKARKNDSAPSNVTSGRSPTQEEVDILVAGRLLYTIENDAQSLQEQLKVSDEVLSFMKENLVAARDYQHQVLFSRIDRMCGKWQQDSLASKENLASVLEYYDTLTAGDNKEISARYNASINSIEANFGGEEFSPINAFVLELRRRAERSRYIGWGSLVMSQNKPEDTIEFHCGEER